MWLKQKSAVEREGSIFLYVAAVVLTEKSLVPNSRVPLDRTMQFFD